MLVEMGHDLMPEQVEINPVRIAAAFCTAQQVAVKGARFGKVPHRKGEMEGP